VNVPKAPAIKVTNKPRGSFTVTEYRQLLHTAKRCIGQRISIKTNIGSKRGRDLVDRYAVVSQDLYWLIRFMVNSFIRPSDIKNLQHKHVTVIRGKHIYLRLNLPASKKHDAPIVTMQPAVAVYERLLTAHKARGLARDDDYLFLPEMTDRGKALEFLGWQFKHCQAVAGVGNNKANGSARTLYSLRHTAITFRLLYGRKIDLLTLARNARTSVDMVEKFYSSNLSAEMNIDLLQGNRRLSAAMD
jgi:integrase